MLTEREKQLQTAGYSATWCELLLPKLAVLAGRDADPHYRLKESVEEAFLDDLPSSHRQFWFKMLPLVGDSIVISNDLGKRFLCRVVRRIVPTVDMSPLTVEPDLDEEVKIYVCPVAVMSEVNGAEQPLEIWYLCDGEHWHRAEPLL